MNDRQDPPARLSPDDEQVLDRLVDAGFDPAVVTALRPEDRSRAERIEALLELLHDYPVEDGDETLTHATLAGIDRYDEEQSARLSFDARRAETTRGRRLRVPDFISVAAVILIAAGILWPTMAHVRQRSVDLTCQNNLRYVGFAMGSYAADNDGAMPAVALAGATWDTFANFLNIQPLFAGNYCDQAHFDCPGHDAEVPGPSYSYQYQTPGLASRWGGGATMTVVLGDRNPIIDAYRAGELVPALTISFNHGGRGQNVLGSDGATLWLKQPVLGGGDNIWLPRGLSWLRRGARPAVQGDVFLAH